MCGEQCPVQWVSSAAPSAVPSAVSVQCSSWCSAWFSAQCSSWCNAWAIKHCNHFERKQFEISTAFPSLNIWMAFLLLGLHSREIRTVSTEISLSMEVHKTEPNCLRHMNRQSGIESKTNVTERWGTTEGSGGLIFIQVKRSVIKRNYYVFPLLISSLCPLPPPLLSFVSSFDVLSHIKQTRLASNSQGTPGCPRLLRNLPSSCSSLWRYFQEYNRPIQDSRQ